MLIRPDGVVGKNGLIFANSPQAKGRVERAFRTFQDCLIPELKLYKIKSIEKANEYLQNIFIKKY